MEVVGPSMVLTMKVINFAWNVCDRPEKLRFVSAPYHDGKPQKRIQITHPLARISWIFVSPYFLFPVLPPRASLHVISLEF